MKIFVTLLLLVMGVTEAHAADVPIIRRIDFQSTDQELVVRYHMDRPYDVSRVRIQGGGAWIRVVLPEAHLEDWYQRLNPEDQLVARRKWRADSRASLVICVSD